MKTYTNLEWTIHLLVPDKEVHKKRRWKAAFSTMQFPTFSASALTIMRKRDYVYTYTIALESFKSFWWRLVFLDYQSFKKGSCSATV